MDLVWYASYGSNLDADRFACYVQGGRPPGAARTYAGCRDPAAPRRDRGMLVSGQVYFAWESPTWGGGIAFFDPAGPGEAAMHAYLVTTGQFSDVCSQEMHRDIGRDLDLGELIAESRTATIGPGRYETLHVVGEIDRLPVVTFSASWDRAGIDLNPPVAAYLRTMARGLQQTLGWDAEQCGDYLASRPGAGPAWDSASVAAVLSDPISGKGSRPAR